MSSGQVRKWGKISVPELVGNKIKCFLKFSEADELLKWQREVQMASTVPPIPKLPVSESPVRPKSTILSISLDKNRSIPVKNSENDSEFESALKVLRTEQKRPKEIEPVKPAKVTLNVDLGLVMLF